MRKGNRRYKNWKDEGFPLWLQQRLEDRGWKAADLAPKIPVVPSLVSRWMDESQRPSPESVLKIADALGVDEVEAMIAAGYLSPRPGEPGTDSPRLFELHKKLDASNLTDDRYRTIAAILNTWIEDQSSNDAPV